MWPAVSSSIYPCFFQRWIRNPLAALLQHSYLNLSQAVMSQVCISPKKSIFLKKNLSSGRCGLSGWNAKEAISPLTILLHLLLASKVPSMCWSGSAPHCVYALWTAVIVTDAAVTHFTKRLPPPLKTAISSSLMSSISYSTSPTCTAFSTECNSVLGPHPIPSIAEVSGLTGTDF